MTVVQPKPAAFDARSGARPVLVVDDSRAQRRLLVKTLAKWGFETIEAASGEAALEISASVDIELVISDWLMPGMSGVEFCRAFRALKADRPAYFILLTAQTERERLAEGLGNGADDFLSKPFHVAELKARLRAGERVLTAQRELIAKNRLLTRTLDELHEVHAAIDRDLRDARDFQQALVPDRFIALPGMDISMLYRPSGHVGGDLVGLFPVSDSRYGVFSVDVAGHGIASALMTARVAGHLSGATPDRNVALAVENGVTTMHPPERVCATLNDLLLREFDTDKYLTMVLADVDLAAGRIIMAQAGHPSPAIQRADGAVSLVETSGMPIGLIEGAAFGRAEISLGPGDRLVLYSDGLTECPSSEGELLDEAGLAGLLDAHRNAAGLDLIDALTSGLIAPGGRGVPDDLSAVVLERRSDQR